VERLRQSLASEFLRLDSLQINSDITGHVDRTVALEEDWSDWVDNLDDETGSTSISEPSRVGSDLSSDDELVLPEKRPINLPSMNMKSNPELRQLERSFQIKQATRHLSALREAIAEKSFQFSHVIRGAPSKAVRTRSRTLIAKINERIGYLCQIYGRSRSALTRLEADQTTLNRFRTLTKEDIKSSTAILNPNIPGSSSLVLSWIWKTQSDQPSYTDSDTMQECQWDQNL
jgi:hypothetical protein